MGVGYTISTQRSTINGRPYIASIDTQIGILEEGESAGKDVISLANTLTWTHLVLELDISGCGSVFLHLESGQRRPTYVAGNWLRIIPRACLLTATAFTCHYKGLTLRDISAPGCLPEELFNTIPTSTDFAWYRETCRSERGLCLSPRMIFHDAIGQITAISVAFCDGAAVSLHFHNGDAAKAAEFYRSLRQLHQTPILRYAKLKPGEHLIDIAVRVRRAWLGCSSACVLVCLDPV